VIVESRFYRVRQRFPLVEIRLYVQLDSPSGRVKFHNEKQHPHSTLINEMFHLFLEVDSARQMLQTLVACARFSFIL
jgi:hypothetical protein